MKKEMKSTKIKLKQYLELTVQAIQQVHAILPWEGFLVSERGIVKSRS